MPTRYIFFRSYQYETSEQEIFGREKAFQPGSAKRRLQPDTVFYFPHCVLFSYSVHVRFFHVTKRGIHLIELFPNLRLTLSSIPFYLLLCYVFISASYISYPNRCSCRWTMSMYMTIDTFIEKFRNAALPNEKKDEQRQVSSRSYSSLFWK